VVLPMPSKTSHWKGNESQDTITLLETVLMSTKRGDETPRRKGLREIY
jgi:hypothetical protein